MSQYRMRKKAVAMSQEAFGDPHRLRGSNPMIEQAVRNVWRRSAVRFVGH
jgi:hypothetical protein